MGSVPIQPKHLGAFWNPNSLGRLADILVHYSEAISRAAMTEPVDQRSDISKPPYHPVHVLQDDSSILTELNAICQQIFRAPLTLDRLSGRAVLRVGVPGVPAPAVDAVTREYRVALANLPALNSQGDGMRSLLGLMLPVVTATYAIVIIDEPEAFLHPPQAFQLGKFLAGIASSRGVQVLLATHDRNLLAGLLDTNAAVAVVRLERHTSGTKAHELSASEVHELWTDPVLRYSNVLEGVFHSVAVIAEGDRDCRFYQAALEAVDDATILPVSPSDIFFIPAGGKDGMARLVRALRAVRVRVVACPDLDILDDATKLRRLVEAFGGEWDELRDSYDKATHDLRAVSVQVTCGEVIGRDCCTIW